MQQTLRLIAAVFFQCCLPIVGETAVPPLALDNTAILDVRGDSKVKPSWLDSYSFNGSCYCQSSFDHAVGDILIAVLGPSSSSSSRSKNMTVRDICALLGPGPGRENRPIYNDIQCGNGPPNNAGDEDTCPGRVDHGVEGCGYIGPRWQLPEGAIAIPITVAKASSAAGTSPLSVRSAGVQALLGILSRLLLSECM